MDLSADAPEPAEWEGEARLWPIAGQVAELMAAFNAGVLSGRSCSPRCRRWRPSRGRLERERPAALPRPPSLESGTLPSLDLNRQRGVVESVLRAVVVSRAERGGAR